MVHAPHDEVSRVFGEFMQRYILSEDVSIEEYARKYPHIASALRMRFESHRAAEKALLDSNPAVSTLGGALASSIDLKPGITPATPVRIDDGASGAAGAAGASGTDAAWEHFLAQLRSRGPTWKRYARREKICAGGQGVIYQAYDQDLRRTVAMKVLRERHEPTTDDVTLGRFLDEAQVTGQLDHPSIVPVHEIGLDSDGRIYFTMKRVRGDDLRAVFAKVHAGADGWSETRALSVVLNVCEAMRYAHDKGVIHRDLKPANVMVGRYGETYVMDWGLARVLAQPDGHDLRLAPQGGTPTAVHTERHELEKLREGESPLQTLDGHVTGTPFYMPPEQANGDIERIGPRSDVYAVGAILYELYAGHPPYDSGERGASAWRILERVKIEPPEPLHSLNAHVPAELQAIVEKAMARSIEARYADMSELAADLRAFLENRVVSAYQVGALGGLRKWVQRNPALAWAILGIALAVIGGAFAFAWSQRAAALGIAAQKRNADANAARADAERERVMRISDIKRLDDLRRRSDELWPALPKMVPAMEDWLREANQLMSRLPEHERTLAELRAKGRKVRHPAQVELDRATVELAGVTGADAESQLARDDLGRRIEQLEREIADSPAYEFDDAESDWWHGALTQLVSGLRDFGADDAFGPTIHAVEERLDFASTIQDYSIVQHAADWAEAIRSIADREQCPKYGGLSIAPQLGLVPIGRDARSGLWEFWHVQTGDRPERGADGRLAIGDATGVVFVLLPGGTFDMGARDDAQAEPDETPVHSIALAPFFLSKYEMTQGQWQEVTGANPSYWNAVDYPKWGSLHLPVDDVSWENCDWMVGVLGLTLPTEAQWEYACRAGTTTPWCCGSDAAQLPRFANVKDVRFGDVAANPGPTEAFDDGFGAPAPVGSLEPNGYGLHDMPGNLWEWCRDGSGSYALPVRAGDGERAVPRPRYRVNRGGCFDDLAVDARCANRSADPPTTRGNNLGLRPARAIDP